MTQQTTPPLIGIVGDRNPELHVHRFTEAAFGHVARPVPFEWIPTEELAAAPPERLDRFTGFLISPGSPYRSAEGALAAIRHARERRLPTLGTCGGFQHMVLEFARNVLGIADAEHEETAPDAPHRVVTALACSLAGEEHPVRHQPGSRVAVLCQAEETVEPFFCRFGINPEYRPALESKGLRVTSFDRQGEPRVLELFDHPFFLATLYVPQARSSTGAPHPIIQALSDAARSLERDRVIAT